MPVKLKIFNKPPDEELYKYANTKSMPREQIR